MIVTELTSPFPPVYPDILFYQVIVNDCQDQDEIKMAVAAKRYEELSGDAPEPHVPGLVEEIARGLKLHVAFFRDLRPDVDYRT